MSWLWRRSRASFDRADYDARGFIDASLSALHYAQKSAIAQRRTVCVTFTATTVTLTVASVFGGACNTNLTGPTGISPHVVTARGATIFSPTPTAFSFTPLGSASLGQTISVSGYTAKTITVDAATGYAY